MNIKDLRIGNILTNGTVVSIDKDSVVCSTGYSIEILSAHTVDSLRPLPLTEEWLIKFGFKKGIKGWFKTHDKSLKFNLYMYNDSKYNHVHQLQNLYFALTGEELEIK